MGNNAKDRSCRMPNERKRKKCDSSTEEESIANTGNSLTERENSIENSGNQSLADTGKLEKRIDNKMRELENARSRCNRKINGHLKGILSGLSKDIGKLLAKAWRADDLESEVAELRKELEKFGERPSMASTPLALRGAAEIPGFGTSVLQSRIEENQDEIIQVEENGIENRYVDAKVAGKDKGKDVGMEVEENGTYAKVAEKNKRKVFGRRDGIEIVTKAVIEARPRDETKTDGKKEGERGAKEIEQRLVEKGRRYNEGMRRTRPEIETIIVRSKAPFREVATNIKTKVDPRKYKIRVLSLRKTNSGMAILRLEGNTEEVRKFREALSECVADNTTIEKVQQMAYMHVSDLDNFVTESEIIEDVCRAAGIGENEIRVTSIRPAYGDSRRRRSKSRSMRPES